MIRLLLALCFAIPMLFTQGCSKPEKNTTVYVSGNQNQTGLNGTQSQDNGVDNSVTVSEPEPTL